MLRPMVLPPAVAGLILAVLSAPASLRAADPAPAAAAGGPALPAPAVSAAGAQATLDELRAGATRDGISVAGFQDGVLKGDEAWRRGDLDRAVWYYVQALTFDDRDAATLAKIGSIHERKGNDRLARMAFEMAASRSPGDARIAERLGLLCMRTQDLLAAQAWFEHARGLDATRIRVAEGLAALAARRNDPARAASLYGEVLQREPDSVSALIGRGEAWLMVGDHAAAEADFVAARSRLAAAGAGPANAAAELASIRRGLGIAFGRSGRYPEALRELLAVLPEHEAWNRLGEMALDRGDYRTASRHFESAIQASPEFFVEARRNLKVAQEFLATRGDATRRAPSASAALPARSGAGAGAGAIAGTSVNASAIAGTGVVRVATTAVRVRAAPDPAGQIVALVQPGERVLELERSADWSRVELSREGQRTTGGWLRSSYLAEAPAASLPPTSRVP